MDEVSRTHDAYEDRSKSFVEKYAAESVAAEYGDAFFSVKRVPLDPDEGTDRHFEYYEPDEFESLLVEAGFDPAIDTPVDRWVGALATA